MNVGPYPSLLTFWPSRLYRKKKHLLCSPLPNFFPQSTSFCAEWKGYCDGVGAAGSHGLSCLEGINTFPTSDLKVKPRPRHPDLRSHRSDVTRICSFGPHTSSCQDSRLPDCYPPEDFYQVNSEIDGPCQVTQRSQTLQEFSRGIYPVRQCCHYLSVVHILNLIPAFTT